MPYATAYSNHMYEVRPFDYQADQITGKIAAIKDQMFDNAYRSIEGAKNETLNLRLFNKDAQVKVNEYNKKINDYFSSNELGKMDLADFGIANQVTSIFKEIGSDKTIGLHKQKTDQFNNIIQEWNSAAKNPGKSGYSESNYLVWQMEHLNDYINGDLNSSLAVDPGSFDPYYDYNKDIKSLLSTVKFDGTKFEIFDKNNPGAKQTVELKELKPEKIKALLDAGLSQEAISQIQKEQKANFYQIHPSIDPLKASDMIYEMSEQLNKSKEVDLQKNIEQLKGRLSAAPEDEKQMFQDQINIWEEELKTKPLLGKDDFRRMSPKQLAEHYARLGYTDKIKRLANGISYRIESRTSSANTPYWNGLSHNLAIQRFNYDMQSDQRDFEYQVAKDQRDFEIEKIKDLNKTSKGDTETDLFLSSSEVGEPLNYKTTNEDILKEVSQLEKLVGLKTLTPDDVKEIYNNPNHNLSFLKPQIDNLVRANGSFNDFVAGQASEVINRSIQSGNLSQQKNDAALRIETLRQARDNAWNNATKLLPQSGFAELSGLLGDQTKLNEVVVAKIKSDPHFADSFNKLWNNELSKLTGTGRSINKIPNPKSDYWKLLRYYDDSGNPVPPDQIQFDGGKIYQNKVGFYTKSTKDDDSFVTSSMVWAEIPKELVDKSENYKFFTTYGKLSRFIQVNNIGYRVDLIKDQQNQSNTHYIIKDSNGNQIFNSMLEGNSVPTDDPDQILSAIQDNLRSR